MKRLKDLQILEFTLINIGWFLSSFSIEILYFVFTFDDEVTITNRGLFRIYFTNQCLYFDLLFIKFCIYDKTGREFYIK